MANRTSKTFAPTSNVPKPDTTNKDGFASYSRPLEERYLQCLLTNTLTNTFYASAHDLLAESHVLHDQMVAKDPVFVGKAIVYARERGFMRTQPIFGLAKLCRSTSTLSQAGVGEVTQAIFDGVIKTPNDLMDFTTIMRSLGKGEGGRHVKRLAATWLTSKLSEYWAIKYGAEKAGSYSLLDLMRVYHPKFGDNPVARYVAGKLIYEDAVTGKTPQIAAFEGLKRATSADDKVAFIGRGRLPHEVTTPFAGSDQTVWQAIMLQMPIFALLRNLATLERHGMFKDPENVNMVCEKFSDRDTIVRSKILPYRFVEAIKHVNVPKIQDALRDALDLSFSNIAEIDGRTCIMIDVSGSMGGENGYAMTAAIFGACLFKRSEGNGRVLLFDTNLAEAKVSMRDSILTQAREMARWGGGGTATYLPFQVITKDKDRFDNIVLITDEQQNVTAPATDYRSSYWNSQPATGAFDWMAQYRKAVNKNTNLFIVNVAPYTNAGSIAPPTDPNIYSVFGWSDQVLNFLGLASQGFGKFVDVVCKS